MFRIRVLAGVLTIGLLTVGLLSGDDTKPADTKKEDPVPKPKGTLPANWKKLGLTDDQVQKVYKLEADYRGQIEPLQAKIKSLQAEEKAEMLKLLTDAQRARLKEIASGDTPDKKPEEKKTDDKKTDAKPVEKKTEDKKP